MAFQQSSIKKPRQIFSNKKALELESRQTSSKARKNKTYDNEKCFKGKRLF
jgi:hypothetical protein